MQYLGRSMYLAEAQFLDDLPHVGPGQDSDDGLRRRGFPCLVMVNSSPSAARWRTGQVGSLEKSDGFMRILQIGRSYG